MVVIVGTREMLGHDVESCQGRFSRRVTFDRDLGFGLSSSLDLQHNIEANTLQLEFNYFSIVFLNKSKLDSNTGAMKPCCITEFL
jgi:hypothetical protein